MSKLVVFYCQLRLLVIEIIRIEEKWLNLSDGTLANHLVHLIFLDVLFNIKDLYWCRNRLLDLQNLRPEHWFLVLLCRVGVIVVTVVIRTLGFVFVTSSTFLEEPAKFSLKVLHNLYIRLFVTKSTIQKCCVFFIAQLIFYKTQGRF